MLRRLATAALLAVSPSAAVAAGGMPQMDFHNPLTADQIIWMVVILIGLYLILARWGLPRIGKVLETRAAVIARDLAAARAAKTAADQTLAGMNAMMKSARADAQGEITTAVAAAKAKASSDAAAMAARLDAQLAASEAQIDRARVAALAAIKPVAQSTAKEMLARLIGGVADDEAVAASVETSLAGRRAA